MASTEEKRKAPDAAGMTAAIDELERQVAKLRKIAPTALKARNLTEFENNIQAHSKRLEKLYVTVDALSDIKQREARKAEKQSELKRIVKHLLPPSAQHVEVQSAEVFDKGKDVLCALKHSTEPQILASCTFRDDPAGPTHRCHIELEAVFDDDSEAEDDDDLDDMQLAFVCELSTGPRNNRLHVNIDTRNLDVFERKFRDAVCDASPDFCKVFGTRPTWAYVLLSMLVYGEEAFAPIEKRIAQRVQRDVDERGVRNVLGKFWTYGRDVKSLTAVIAPFLVRLMPPAFALRLDLERDAKLFY